MLSLFPIDRIKEAIEEEVHNQRRVENLTREDSRASLNFVSDDGEESDYGLREQDRLLPMANIVRIMKKVLPDNAKIAREARDLIQESASEFIMFIASEAAEYGIIEKRRTMVAEDILRALENMGMDPYLDPMRYFLIRHRQLVRCERLNTISTESQSITDS